MGAIKLELPHGWLALVDPCWRAHRRGFALIIPIRRDGGLRPRPTVAVGHIDAINHACTVDRGVAPVTVLGDLSRAIGRLPP